MDARCLYYILVFIAALFAWLYQIIYRKTNKKSIFSILFLSLSYFSLLFLLGTRVCGVGVDDNAYLRIFNRTNEVGALEVFKTTMLEPGYLLINRIIGLFTNDFQVVILLISALSLAFVYAAILRESRNINFLVAFLLFGLTVYPYFFGIIRLSLAVSISFYATKYIARGNRKKYNSFILLAASMHYSALVLLIMNLVIKKPLNRITLKKFYAKLLIIVPLALIAFSAIIVPLMSERYSRYALSTTFSLSILDFDKIPIVLLGLFFLKMIEKRTENYPLYLFMYSLTIVITLCSSFVSFGRIEWYFNIYVCVVIPSIISTLWSSDKERVINLFLVPLVIVYGIIYSNRLLNKESHILDIDHYESTLFKEA